VGHPTATRPAWTDALRRWLSRNLFVIRLLSRPPLEERLEWRDIARRTKRWAKPLEDLEPRPRRRRR